MPAEKTEVKKHKVKTIDLPVVASGGKFKSIDINKLMEQEVRFYQFESLSDEKPDSIFFLCLQNEMIMQDKLEKERGDAKNAVEEYVYDMRNKLSAEYEKFIKEEVVGLCLNACF